MSFLNNDAGIYTSARDKGDGTPITDVKVLEGNGEDAFSVAPHDTNAFQATKGLYLGVSGDVRVKMKSGNIITFKGLSAGVIHPISITMVYATGTTALEIVGVY